MADARKIDNVSTIDSAITVLRTCTEQSLYDADDLVAELLVTRSRVNHADIAIQLAESFVRLVHKQGIDAGLKVVVNDLLRAIDRAKGVATPRTHYDTMARDAQDAAA